ncbi:MAG: ribonucleoside-diphosphate reductase subunit alpha, partial [Planctomycetales bacterium]|nr:ribonucleoside-diphosphate reductase subunit alpha [Planctomycetales bacterium]
KGRYATSFEIEPKWLIECAARRQKWLDMGQSLNLYLLDPNGRKLDEMYRLAWRKGLKTTYYLRTLAATSIEPTTVRVTDDDEVRPWMRSGGQATEAAPAAPVCNLGEDCEACQ